MNGWKNFIAIGCLLIFSVAINHSVEAQQNLAQQAYAIFQQNCLNCHGEHGAFTEEIVIEHTALIETGAVVPGKPIESELYKRLLTNDPAKRMPLGQPQLPAAAILTIGNWIQAGAPDWADTSETDGPFITPKEMLEAIEKHINSLPPSDRAFTRYFTMTHLYNAGESAEALHAYQRALSKLVNSLSWGREIVNPQPIDPEETIFYVDLRDYEWDVGVVNRWTLIDAAYPYGVAFNAPSQTTLREKLTNLREAMECEVPFVHADWFIATASLPPLYHDILDLPRTDRALEAKLGIDVVSNLRNAAGRRVWRAGFNVSGVSNNNRVVERHQFQNGAYWKSYDFAGSVGTQYVLTHPLSFTHDGGEIIFNLPNRLQAYLLIDAGGNRLNEAPIEIVSNAAASDPTVRNGLSCIGCHTEGMKTFEDQVRSVVSQNPNPPFDKDRALRLYVEQKVMDALVEEDTMRYRQALAKTGGVFGGIEPVQRFHEAFQRPLDASQAAAAVGLEAEVFLQKIRENTGLQNLGLLVLENDTVNRDTWTELFSEIIFALDFPERSRETPIEQRTERLPGESVHIPDPNLRAVIEEELGKSPGTPITVEDMRKLEIFGVPPEAGVRVLTGLETATRLTSFSAWGNPVSDITPLLDLQKLHDLNLNGTRVSDLRPFANLTKLEYLRVSSNGISDISPLANLVSLKELELIENGISDLSPLAKLTQLKKLALKNNLITDVSPLAKLTQLKWVSLEHNLISDFSPLEALLESIPISSYDNPGFRGGGPKIEGPWLWVTVPGESDLWHPDSTHVGNRDLLAAASNNRVTEQEIATQGATEGDIVGDGTWTTGELEGEALNNINTMLREGGLKSPEHPPYVVYAVTILYSPWEQDTHMFVGSDMGSKVWLNGALIRKHNGYYGHPDYQTFFPVTLKRGKNVLLVAIDNNDGDKWGGYFGFASGTEYAVSHSGIGYNLPEAAIHIGDTFTVQLNAENISDLAGWQFDITFDPTVLEAVEVNEGDLLKSEGGTTFFQRGTIDNTTGKITDLSAARFSEEGATGTGTLLSVTFSAKATGETRLALHNFQLWSITNELIAVEPYEVVLIIEDKILVGDVNQDGWVNILDMVLVSQYLGQTASANSKVDVNNDGIINILDLVLVARHLGESTAAAAPSLSAIDSIEGLDSAMIQAWIEQAQIENDGSIAFQQGIAYLQSLLALLIPEETALLPNYPNPFNPETWIPYQLSEPAEVTLRIYAINGTLIRTLALGQTPAGIYQSRSRAAYWDGRNDVGESVASGLYFYTLTADDFTATRKMLIRK